MRMANRNGEGIRRIGPGDFDSRQLHPHHVVNLALVGVPDAHNCLLDRVRRILANDNPCPRRHEHRNPPGLAQFQRRCSVLVDERLFNSRLIRAETVKYLR